MRNHLLKVLAAAVLLGFAPQGNCGEEAGNGERMKKLEELMEVAVDQFQLNRYIEARAALNRLIAENPNELEAFNLRRLFGERILLEMQKYGDRPTLSSAERQVVMLLGEAGFALDMQNGEKAADRVKVAIDALRKGGYAEDSFEVRRAIGLEKEVADLKADNVESFRQAATAIRTWKEELQSVGNAPLLLLSRAQRYEQSQLRSPEMIRKIISGAVKSSESAQRYMLEIDRLGVYAVPELIKYLRDNKDDSSCTNAHFILLTLGNQITVPLCAALKSKDQLLLQQICSIFSEMKPKDTRALPYLKAVYENKENLASTHNVARLALEATTGKQVAELASAAEYFLAESNRYYLGGPQIDSEVVEMNGALWVWDGQAGGNKGELALAEVPSFLLPELIAEEMAYRGMEQVENKVPFQVLLASIFMQQKNKVDVINKLLFREDMSLPDAQKMRTQANQWKAGLDKNMRIVYAMGADYISAVLEKAMADQKFEFAVSALDAITLVAGKDGWAKLKNTAMAQYGSALTPAKTSAPASITPAAQPAAPAPAAPTAPQAVPASGTAASGDAGVAAAAKAPVVEAAPAVPAAPVVQPAAAAPVVAPAPTSFSGTAADPLVKALNYPADRVSIAAANCLARIGLPASDAAYQKLLPLLVKGSEENRATVSLIISNNSKVVTRFSREMEKGQVIPMTTSDGYSGYLLATQYPPKDAILIDNSIDQFDMLKLQLELRQVSHGKVLPLVIITTRDHATRIAEQFSKEEIEKAAKEKHIDSEQIVNAENNTFENKPWRVVVRHNVTFDTKGIFEDLVSLNRYGNDTQPVVILTNPTREGRYQLKEGLMIKAERELRPMGLTEYSQIKNKDRVLGDIFGVRSTYVPVFVDEELGGYDAMKTLQALQTDPRTRPVPVAILTDDSRMKDVEKDFELFTKDNKVRILSRDLDGRKLIDTINEMQKENALSQQNYARLLSNNIAQRSAEALDTLDTAAFSSGLSINEQKALAEIVADTTRPQELRIASAQVLGHFKAEHTTKKLMNLFNDTDKKEVKLRVAILQAIGEIDQKNEYMEFKLQAMNEPEVAIQEMAAKVLGPAAQNSDQIRQYLNTLRPNDPLKLVQKPAAVAAEEGEKKAEEPKAEEKAEGEKKTEEKAEGEAKSEEKAESKEEKKEEVKEEEKKEEKAESKEEKKEEKKKEEAFNW